MLRGRRSANFHGSWEVARRWFGMSKGCLNCARPEANIIKCDEVCIFLVLFVPRWWNIKCLEWSLITHLPRSLRVLLFTFVLQFSRWLNFRSTSFLSHERQLCKEMRLRFKDNVLDVRGSHHSIFRHFCSNCIPYSRHRQSRPFIGRNGVKFSHKWGQQTVAYKLISLFITSGPNIALTNRRFDCHLWKGCGIHGKNYQEDAERSERNQ